METVKTFEYKGKCVRISFYPSEPKPFQYKAEVLNGSDAAYDETLSGVEQQIKNRIDNIPTYQAMNFHPLSDEELERLIRVISNEENAFWIKQKLQKQHYIPDNNSFGFGAKEIYYHFNIIEETLRSQGYSFCLKCQKVPQLTRNPYYILYDADYYDTEVKLTRLLNKLKYENDD